MRFLIGNLCGFFFQNFGAFVALKVCTFLPGFSFPPAASTCPVEAVVGGSCLGVMGTLGTATGIISSS